MVIPLPITAIWFNQNRELLKRVVRCGGELARDPERPPEPRVTISSEKGIIIEGMSRRLQFALALVVVFAVAAIFVLPAFDLIPTAMRAWRAAQMIALAIAAAAIAVPRIQPDLFAFMPLQSPTDNTISPDVLAATCSRLC